MRKLGPLLAVALFGISLAAPAQDRGTWLKSALVTDDKYSREEKAVIPPDAPAIYAVYRIVAAGPVRLRVAFWADTVEGFNANSKLLEKVVPFQEAGEFMGTVTAQKPLSGWPAGAYRVEFSFGETLAKSVAFRVPRRPDAR